MNSQKRKNSQTSFIKIVSHIQSFVAFFVSPVSDHLEGKYVLHANEFTLNTLYVYVHSRDFANFCPKLSKNGQIPPPSRICNNNLAWVVGQFGGGIAKKLDLNKKPKIFSHALYQVKASTDFNSEKNILSLFFYKIIYIFSHC